MYARSLERSSTDVPGVGRSALTSKAASCRPRCHREVKTICYFDGHVRHLGSIPESLLQALDERLQASEALWPEANASKPNRFDCFGSTEHIVFQYPSDLRCHLSSAYTPLWPDWQTLIAPIMASATQAYGYPSGRSARIMLARVPAGAEIHRHVDEMASADLPHKIHVPIRTHPQVRFLEGNAVYHLHRGGAFEVNNKIPHGVQNRSPIARIHLIFDWYSAACNAAASRP